MAFGSELRAPHGGIFVVALISHPVLYLLAIAIGAVVAAISVIALMSLHRRRTATVPATPVPAAVAA
jgi:PTS system fructose-specific IIC component